MDISPIETDDDYRKALARINELMDAEANTPEAEELGRLATLVESYEDVVFPIDDYSCVPDMLRCMPKTMVDPGTT